MISAKCDPLQMREKLLQLSYLYCTIVSEHARECHRERVSARSLGAILWVLHVDNFGYWHKVRQTNEHPNPAVQDDRLDLSREANV